MAARLVPVATARAAVAAGLLAAAQAQAFVANIQQGQRSLYLQVGAGTMTGGPYANGGNPGDNTTVNTVSVTVPAASVGAGPRNMTSDSAVANSPYDGFAFCDVPAEVYVGGFYRGPNSAPATAVLRAEVPANLTNAAGDTIPFNRISWVSGGNGDAAPTIPSGTFTGGTTQTLLAVNRNTWFESCLAFRYANSELVPAGTFTGRVRFTLSTP